jgi:hypothetical protein
MALHYAGSPLAVILYVLLKDADSVASMPQRPPVVVIGWGVAVVIAMVCGLTWIVTAVRWASAKGLC